MIVGCPSCATRYEMPDQQLRARRRGGALPRLRLPLGREPRGADHRRLAAHRCRPGAYLRRASREAERLVEAAQLAREAFLANRRSKTAERRVWACFAAAHAAARGAACPAIPNRWCAPRPPRRASTRGRASRSISMGWKCAGSQQEHVIVDGIRLSPIKGEIVNVSGRATARSRRCASACRAKAAWRAFMPGRSNRRCGPCGPAK